MSALDRWRERCDRSGSTDIGVMPERLLRPGDTVEATEQRVADYVEAQQERCGKPLCPVCEEQRLALTWLREEMTKDPDHA